MSKKMPVTSNECWLEPSRDGQSLRHGCFEWLRKSCARSRLRQEANSFEEVILQSRQALDAAISKQAGNHFISWSDKADGSQSSSACSRSGEIIGKPSRRERFSKSPLDSLKWGQNKLNDAKYQQNQNRENRRRRKAFGQCWTSDPLGPERGLGKTAHPQKGHRGKLESADGSGL